MGRGAGFMTLSASLVRRYGAYFVPHCRYKIHAFGGYRRVNDSLRPRRTAPPVPQCRNGEMETKRWFLYYLLKAEQCWCLLRFIMYERVSANRKADADMSKTSTSGANGLNMSATRGLKSVMTYFEPGSYSTDRRRCQFRNFGAKSCNFSRLLALFHFQKKYLME